MSSKNDDSSGIVMVIAFLGAGMLFFAAFLFAVLAWNRPIPLGRFVMTPEEARPFVGRGIAGAILLPVFAVFCAALFGFPLRDEWWAYLVICGYTLGSIGVEILMAQDEGANGAAPAPPPMAPYSSGQTIDHEPTQPALPPVQREPFRYASWDDEEAGR